MIEHIYVACHRKDFHLTKLCVASIRYWHPDVPVTLIKDYQNGDFDTRELEENWDVRLFSTPIKKFGLGFSKLEALFLPQRFRYLMLDSDLVLVGPVLDYLNQTTADFVIHPELNPGIDLYAYDRQLLKVYDSNFIPPSFIFNTGQYVATSGLLQRSDFDDFVEWGEPRKLLRPDIFKAGEQGLFNYQIFKARAEGRFSVQCGIFYSWGNGNTQALKLEMIRRRTSSPMVLHWAGAKSEDLSQMPRSDILHFYREYYCSRISSAQKGKP